MRVPGAWAGGALAAGVLAIAAVAALDAVRGGSEPVVSPAEGADARAVGGPLVPQPGLLPGSLTFVAADGCELTRLDLGAVVLHEPGPASCDLWAAPRGDLALVSAGRQGRRYELWLARLGDAPRLVRRLGPARGDPAWSSDGAHVAWCSPAGTTRVLELASGVERAVAGCSPRFAPDGGLLTRPDRPVSSEVLRDGGLLLGDAELARGFTARPDRVDVLAVDESRRGLLAVTVASVGDRPAEVVLELWRGRRLVAAQPLPAHLVPGVGALGELLRFSPTGDELAVGFPRPAFGLIVLDIRSGRVVREEAPARGFAWSPDGRWLAVATRDEIVIAGTVRSETVYALPVAAGALAWS